MLRILPWQFTKLCIVFFFYVECQEWEKSTSNVNVVFEKISSEINAAIIFANFTAVSLLQCSYMCERTASMSLYYLEHGNECYCNNGTDSVEDEGGLHSLDRFYGEFIITQIFGYKHFTKWRVIPEKQDCYELYKSGYTTDGVYRIKPESGTAVETWCDMQNGGWTTVQHRYDGSENFTRGWSDYKNGFGHVTGEFWLGLDHLHHFAARPCTIVIHMIAPPDKTPAQAYLIYYNATIGGQLTNYTLSFSSFDSDCADRYTAYSYYVQNGSRFSTIDSYFNFCANLLGGGWWFGNTDSGCGKICLNGFYGGFGMTHFSCWGSYVSLPESWIKLRI